MYFFFSVFGYAQQTKIDSLTILFNETKADTTKAEILAKIGIAAYFVDFKKAKFFNDSLISFSKGKSKKHEALGYRMQGTLQLIDGDYSNAQQSYMQSLNIFEDIGDDSFTSGDNSYFNVALHFVETHIFDLDRQ